MWDQNQPLTVVAVLKPADGTDLPQQVDGDIHRDDLALLDVTVDELTELGALPRPLCPQQVPGGQMGVAVVLGGRERKTV